MLKKKSLARKLLEYRTKKRHPSPPRGETEGASQISAPSLWKSLLDDFEEPNPDSEVKHSNGSIFSEAKSRIEVDLSLPVIQVDKDNNQGCPSISLEPENPIAEDAVQNAPHDQDSEDLQKLKEQMTSGKICKEETFSFKTNVAINDISYEYRLIRKRSKSRKVTKSFCRSPFRLLDSKRRLASLGKKRRLTKVSSPKPLRFKLPVPKPLHELRAAITNYTYTRKRSIKPADQEDLDCFESVNQHHRANPRPRACDPKQRASLLSFTSPRRTVVVPCFDEAAVHVFLEDGLKTNLMPSKRDEDNDSSDSLIKFAMQKAYHNLKLRVDDYKLHKPQPAAARKEKTPDNHVKLKDGWVQIKPRPLAAGLQDNPSVKKKYEELLHKNEERLKQKGKIQKSIAVAELIDDRKESREDDVVSSKIGNSKTTQ